MTGLGNPVDPMPTLRKSGSPANGPNLQLVTLVARKPQPEHLKQISAGSRLS